MPIVQKKPSAPPDYVPNIPKIEPERSKSVVVDTKYTPRSSLLKYVEGSPWTVNYYSQIHDRDNATYSQDPGQNPLYQQYKKIERLELRVSNALTSQQDPDSKGFSVKGSAHLPLAIIPNEGDMFVADVGDGREGVFQIDNSEKKSIFKESVYFIEYTMLYYADAETSRRKDLEDKVVANLHFVKELAQYGQKSIITTDRYNVLREISFQVTKLKKNYFQFFYSNEYSTLVVPDQEQLTYDPHVVKTLMKIMNTQDVHEFKRMRALNIEDDNYLKLPVVLEALVNRDLDLLYICEQQYGTISTRIFNRDPMTESIFYSGFEKIIYPHPRNDIVDQRWSRSLKGSADGKLVEGSTLAGNTSILLENNVVRNHENKPVVLIHPVTKDDYYIFSKAFYDETDGMSLLEVLAFNYLQREANKPELVLHLMKNCWKWGSLERFYYIPVLLILAANIIKEI